MNKSRRKSISKAIQKLEKLKTLNDRYVLKNIIDSLNSVYLEEEMAFDNMPENLQYSFNGMESHDAIIEIELALDFLEEADNAENDEELCEKIENAIAELEGI